MSDCGHKIPHISGRTQVFPPSDPCGGSVHFTGVDDTSINQGVGIDLSDGVHAYDGHGNEIPFTYSPTEIDKCDVGRHEVTYEAEGEGERFQPTFPFDRVVHTTSCGNIRKTVTRIITIVKSLPPRILGIANTLLPVGSYFNPMDGVSGVDDNGNATEVTFEGRYDVQTEKAPIASFESDIVQSAKSLLVTLDPIQSGSGTPSPNNVRPISGRTEVVTQRTGKNLLNLDRALGTPNPSAGSNTTSPRVMDTEHYYVGLRHDNYYYPSSVAEYTVANNEVTVRGANNAYGVGFPIEVKPNTQYKVSATVVGSGYLGITYYDAQWHYISFRNNVYEFTTPSNASYAVILLRSLDTSETATWKSVQVELGSTATDYEPYDGETYTTTLGQTVYGGTLDVVSGELVVEYVKQTITAFNGVWNTSNPNGTPVYAAVTNTDHTVAKIDASMMKSNIFTYASEGRASAPLLGYGGNDGVNTAQTFILPSTVATLAEANAWLSNLSEPLECTFKLATPQTYQLDPQTIELLLGQNNVWSDGDVTVVYSRPLGQGATKFDVEGIYQITYHTEDECGNETDAVRVVAVSDNRYRTVIYEDGTFIINEDILDQPSNVTKHGEAKYIYEPMLEDGSNYVWTSEPNTLWHRTFEERNSINRVEIGSHIQPISIAYWFFHFDYCNEMDLTNLDTSRCTDMSYAFAYVGYFVSTQDAVPYLDLSHFDTSKVTSMRYMFNHLVGTKVIDISSWEVASTVDTHMLFSYCESVKTIYASDEFEIPATLDYSFFNSCSHLVGGEGTAYNDQDYTKSESTYARIDNPPEAPGYFTAK